MKRLWLGLGILALLTAAGFWAMAHADNCRQRVCDALNDATQAALAEDWNAVRAHAHRAQKAWEETLDAWTALSDHTQLDEIEAGFARLDVYCRDAHATDFAAESASLAQQLKALGESHRLSLRNLF